MKNESDASVESGSFASGNIIESRLKAIESALARELGANVGANVTENIRALKKLTVMNKFTLETFFVQFFAMISLNDQEYERLQKSIKELLRKNEEAAIRQGIFI